MVFDVCIGNRVTRGLVASLGPSLPDSPATQVSTYRRISCIGSSVEDRAFEFERDPQAKRCSCAVYAELS
jgi:hypothetical protein